MALAYPSKEFSTSNRKTLRGVATGEEGKGHEIRIIFRNKAHRWRAIRINTTAKSVDWRPGTFESTERAKHWLAEGDRTPAVEL